MSSYYLNQIWQNSTTPFGVTIPQVVKYTLLMLHHMCTKYSQILMITTTSPKRRITMRNLLVIYITISPLTVTVCGRTPYYYIVRGLEAMRTGFTPHSLQWHHNGRDSVSNHQPHDCLLKRLFRRRAKKTSKLRVTGLCVGNSPETGEFPAQMASNAENVSIWWRHHVF